MQSSIITKLKKYLRRFKGQNIGERKLLTKQYMITYWLFHSYYQYNIAQLNLMVNLAYFALLIIVSLSACPNSFGAVLRTFNINYTTSDCSTFEFINCTYTQAKQDEQQQYQIITTYNWGTCLFDCCKISYAELTYQTLRACKEYNEKSNKYRSVSIAFGVISGLLFLVILLIVCNADMNHCWQGFKASWSRKCPCFQDRSMGSKVANDQINQSSAVLKEQISRNQLEWKPISIAEIILKDRNNCAICLEEEPSVRLNCLHSFHPQCILTWTQKNNTCPQCRAAIVATDIISKICQKCYFRKRVIKSLRESERYKFCHYCQSGKLEKISVPGSLKQQYIYRL